MWARKRTTYSVIKVIIHIARFVFYMPLCNVKMRDFSFLLLTRLGVAWHKVLSTPVAIKKKLNSMLSKSIVVIVIHKACRQISLHMHVRALGVSLHFLR